MAVFVRDARPKVTYIPGGTGGLIDNASVSMIRSITRQFVMRVISRVFVVCGIGRPTTLVEIDR